MNKVFAAIAVILVLSQFNLYCVENSIVEDKNDTRNFYLQFDNDYTEINGKISSTIGFSGAYELNENFSIGLTANGIWYDYRLKELDPDMTYHVESGYTGIYLQGNMALTERLGMNLSLMSGSGIVQLKYDHKYRKELKWDEEIIDRETFSVAELKLGANYRISDFWKLGLSASYRSTSEIWIESLERDIFNNLKFGVAIQYSIF